MGPFPAPETGILLTHFAVSEDIARSHERRSSWLLLRVREGPKRDSLPGLPRRDEAAELPPNRLPSAP
jgi:hypothetical protein